MTRGSRGRRLGAGLASCLVAAVLGVVAPMHAVAATGDVDRPEGSVLGTGGGTLTFPGFEGHPVRFSVAAQGYPGQSSGRFHVNHVLPDGAPFADFSGRVDCVAVDRDLAIVTGIVERADLPGVPGIDLVGRRIGLTVRDQGGQDRIGWSWAVAGLEHDVAPCTGTVPFFPVDRGGFLVR